ncbi:hypothetical protein [Mycolicibacterium llatzerense]|uniref:hypothetical protein n=1 Tax=Mycolicibacterium llatzerense TaxID=280871 RepID=UPI0021B649CC|nr:hypothetical protein [Mycolicibacterium llatzerense]MCT7361212.1 hypothetical protein [Mycolicibacterium llatzerense]MCT7366488.1 hypothetical protein [Mycolicibacterium llatzerense]
MRIVGLQELLTLPNGTLFAELREPWVFGELYLKGDNLGGANNDFWSKSLAWPDADESGMAFSRLDAMLVDPTVSYPADEGYTRGEYLGETRDYKFLVYEPADTAALIELLKEAL